MRETACFLVCLKQDERQKTRHRQLSTTRRCLVDSLFNCCLISVELSGRRIEFIGEQWFVWEGRYKTSATCAL